MKVVPKKECWRYGKILGAQSTVGIKRSDEFQEIQWFWLSVETSGALALRWHSSGEHKDF